MMSRHSRRLVLAALTGLLLVAPAVPAYADDEWHSPPCATGEITNYHLDPAHHDGDVIIQVAGWSTPCPPEGPPWVGNSEGYQFGLIFYSPAQGWLGRLSEYGPGPGPTTFSYHVNHTDERRYGPITGICLAYAEYDRLSCLAVDLAHSPFLTPVPGDDQRFGVPVDGNCGNCAGPPHEEDGG
jgi:hypothetical protein